MPATLEQPTTQQMGTTLMPTVVYDNGTKSINATIIVSFQPQAEGSNLLQFNAPVIGVPGSGSPDIAETWKVIWTVVPGSGLDWVKFTNVGLQIPASDSSLPPQVDPISPSPVAGRPNMWQAAIRHQITYVNSFNYLISVEGRGPNFTTSFFASHDPTIVVVLDPMG